MKGNFFNLPFTSKFQGAKNKDKSIGNLSIQSNDLKFYFDADLTDINFLKSEFLGNAKVRFVNSLSTIGLNNLTLQFNFDWVGPHQPQRPFILPNCFDGAAVEGLGEIDGHHECE